MDILEPNLVWVEDRCYRVFDNSVWSSEKSDTPYEDDYYQSEEEYKINNEMCDEDEIEIIATNNGGYKHVFHVPKAYYGFIIGTKGSAKKQIEVDTKSSILIPKIDSKSEIVEIRGNSRAGVISCRHRIDLLIASSKNKIRFTHFVSIPLNSEMIVKNYENFKQNVLNDTENESKGISENIFVSSKKLHLTIGMLRLLTDEEKKVASEVLSNCVKDVINPILLRIKSPITIKIQGLNYMNDDPSKMSVLYGQVLKNDALQEIADRTLEYFVEKGLMTVQHTKNVKLHMTLMKSSRKLNKRGPNKFDATNILQDYKDYSFGDVSLNVIDISEVHTAAADGYYKTVTKINLS